MAASSHPITAEEHRLAEDASRKKNWKRWGPYLSERQWGTVREDYSADGDCWNYLPHDHARSRAYRWGEDGLLGITDRECRLCFALALWNTQDPILKERLFGLTGPEGNHGEDVKEYYFYLDSTPTHSYMKALYKYPQSAFPYDSLVQTNRARTRHDPEFEIGETGVFNDNRFFDITAEYAKADADDILIRLTFTNRGDQPAPLHVLPTLWFRNAWSWGPPMEDSPNRPELGHCQDPLAIEATHDVLGRFELAYDVFPGTPKPQVLYTENETNYERIFHSASATPYVKDAFHRFVVNGEKGAVNPYQTGTKAAFHCPLMIPARGEITLRLRLRPMSENPAPAFGKEFDAVFAARMKEADAFYEKLIPATLGPQQRNVARQAQAGLLWSKQFYHYAVDRWLDGDPTAPPPPESRKEGRNSDWRHLFSRDVLSMPDKWEYPWFAAWDLGFHMIPMAKLDPDFAKDQLLLLLREWYMHPNGQLPAYEFAFNDTNPPVHAWAVWRVYKMSAPRGQRDVTFLARAFQKLLLNFTWWVNRKDITGKHVFAGGFLGLDNIGLFDRSKPLPGGALLNQADGTAWMAFYCGTMLSIALELATHDIAYEDVASKFFEHFVAIVDAINTLGGTGLWDETDGFYYDHLKTPTWTSPLRVRSLVGIIPAFAVEVFKRSTIDRLPGFSKRLNWFLQHRTDLARHISFCSLTPGGGTTDPQGETSDGFYLLAIPSKEKLQRLLRYVFDESEFLSPYGIRSVSRIYKDQPYVFHFEGQTLKLEYDPGESTTALFGGNSNWRGPVWFPINFLLIEALERYAFFYHESGEKVTFEYPTGSGKQLTLKQIAADLRLRLLNLFLRDKNGRRPSTSRDLLLSADPAAKDLVLFHEYFHGDTGAGLGASHQTGWTALIASLITGQQK
jgi:hypothetical protein